MPNNNAGNQYDSPNQEVVRAGDDKPPKPQARAAEAEKTEPTETPVSDTPVSDEPPKRRKG